MAANKQQGSYLTLFWTGATALCAGLAYLAEGFGKLVLVLGLAAGGIRFGGVLKIKPGGGKRRGVPGDAVVKSMGVGGWMGGRVVTRAGAGSNDSDGGR